MKHATSFPPVRDTGRRWFWCSLLAIFLMSAGWALASPISSVPDEPAHIVKAASVVRGEMLGEQVGDGGPLLAVDVPRYIEHTNQITCFVRNLTLTPDCSPEIPGDANEIVAGLTSAGLYNPVYYAAVGWPTLIMDGSKAIYAMRLVSALLTSLFLAFAFSAVSRLSSNKWALLTLSVAVTPMTLFLNGSVNPNSLEYGTTAAIAANLFLLLNRAEAGSLPLFPVAVTTVAAALLANTKALSLLWLLVVVVAVFILASLQQIKVLMRHPAVWTGSTVVGLSCAFAVWWVLAHNSLASKPFEGAGMDFGEGTELMIDRSFLFMRGYIGQFGWLELDAPTGVMSFWTAMFFAAVLGACVYSRGRQRVAIIFMALCLLILPVVLQAIIITDQGMVWQGRYILAVFVPCLLVAGIALDQADRKSWPLRARTALVTVLLTASAAQIITFVWVLRRYVTALGMDVRWIDMLHAPLWQPRLGTVPTTGIFVAGTVLGTVFLLGHIRANTNWPAPGPALPVDARIFLPDKLESDSRPDSEADQPENSARHALHTTAGKP